jgi:XTP/dITP diphosphohydrolase
MKVGFVSRNPGKLRELRDLLPTWEIDPIDTTGIGEEGGATFYENALEKARFGRRVAPGRWILAEDSGLEVDALDGEPGIRSARFAGPEATDDENLDKLLAALERVATTDCRGRYRCEIVLFDPSGCEYRGMGVLEGAIVAERRGTGGFGYDPVFVPDGERKTVGELGDGWKGRHSHRARAARALLEALSARAAPR